MSSSEKELKKFFDKKNYNTVVVSANNDGNTKKTNDKTSLIDLFANENNKDLKEDVLKILKQNGGAEILIDAISKLKSHPKKYMLVAAFWEANIDCKEHLDFFVELALNDTYEVCLEALTVIEEMQTPSNEKNIALLISKSKDWLNKNKNNNKFVLIENLLLFLENFKTANK